MTTFTWNDELKSEASSIYQGKMGELAEANPDKTEGEYTMEAVTFTAEQLGASVASTRMCLSKQGVYVKVKQAKPAAKEKAAGGGKKMNKAEAHAELASALKDIGVGEPDMEIIGKLTGKAAAYLAESIRPNTDAE